MVILSSRLSEDGPPLHDISVNPKVEFASHQIKSNQSSRIKNTGIRKVYTNENLNRSCENWFDRNSKNIYINKKFLSPQSTPKEIYLTNSTSEGIANNGELIKKYKFGNLRSFMHNEIAFDLNSSRKIVAENEKKKKICIKISLLQDAMKFSNYNNLLEMIHLLNDLLDFQIFVVTHESEKNVNKLSKKLNNALPFLHQIITSDSSEKAFKKSNTLSNSKLLIFPQNFDDWPENFNRNKNEVYIVHGNSNDIVVFHENSSYQFSTLFKAIQQIYEHNYFVHFLREANKETMDNKSISLKNYGFVWQEKIFPTDKDDLDYLKKLLYFKLFMFYQIDTKKKSKFNMQKIQLQKDLGLAADIFDENFVVEYKNNSQYYCYLEDCNDGCLLSFGSAFAIGFLLGGNDWFDNIQFIPNYKRMQQYLDYSELWENKKNKNKLPKLLEDFQYRNLCGQDKLDFLLLLRLWNCFKNSEKKIWEDFFNTKHKATFEEIYERWTGNLKKHYRDLEENILNKLNYRCIAKQEEQLHSEIFLSMHENTRKVGYFHILKIKELTQTEIYKLTNIKVFNEIGRGSRSTVYKGEIFNENDISCCGQHIAIKRINDCSTLDDLFFIYNLNGKGIKFRGLKKSSIQKEIEILAMVQTIHSPFLIKCLGFRIIFKENTSKHYFEIIEEKCEGTLQEYLNYNNSLSENDAIVILSQIVEGLYFLHKNNITHRDLKPDNILYKTRKIQGNDVKFWVINDFGHASTSKIMKKSITYPKYVAPEMKEMDEYNQKVDVYSLGLIFHLLLFQEDYYNYDNQNDLYDLSSDQKNKISKEAFDLLMKMCSSPENRPSIFDVRKYLNDKFKREREIIKDIYMAEEMTESDIEKSNINLFISKMKISSYLNKNGLEWLQLGYPQKAINLLDKALFFLHEESISRACIDQNQPNTDQYLWTKTSAIEMQIIILLLYLNAFGGYNLKCKSQFTLKYNEEYNKKLEIDKVRVLLPIPKKDSKLIDELFNNIGIYALNNICNKTGHQILMEAIKLLERIKNTILGNNCPINLDTIVDTIKNASRNAICNNNSSEQDKYFKFTDDDLNDQKENLKKIIGLYGDRHYFAMVEYYKLSEIQFQQKNYKDGLESAKKARNIIEVFKKNTSKKTFDLILSKQHENVKRFYQALEYKDKVCKFTVKINKLAESLEKKKFYN